MAEFDVSRAIPVNDSDQRQPTFDISRAVPADNPQNVDMSGPLAMNEFVTPTESQRNQMASDMKQGENTAKVIRWPYWRFIEHPVSTLVAGAQEGAPLGETLAKAGQAFVPFKQIPPEEYGTYGKVWDNYYQAAMKLDNPNFNESTPDWYVAMASYGSAMVGEPAVIKGAAVATENALTRVATPEEAAAIKSHFEPLQNALNKRGLNTEDLHPEGNIIKIDQDNEIFMNKYVSAVLRGDEIRVPRWAKVNMPSSPPAVIENPPTAGTPAVTSPEVLPTTGPEVTLNPTAPAAPMENVQKTGKVPVFKNTEEALAFGKANADNQPLIQSLQDTYDVNLAQIKDLQAKSEAAVQAGDMKLSDDLDSQGYFLAQKNQLYREAVESASGKLESANKLKPITIDNFNQRQQPLNREELKVDPEIIDKVNQMQNILGKQLSISSGFRTPEYNALLKSQKYNVADNSLHLQGRAADIPVSKELTHKELVDAAHQVGLDVEAIKLTPKHVHVELPTENTPTPELEPKAIDREVVAPENIQPNSKGITKLEQNVEALKTDKEKYDSTKDTLRYFLDLRQEFKGRIKRYKGDKLAEELSGLNKYYVTTTGGISPDEAMDELRSNYNMTINDETDLIRYFNNIDSTITRLKGDLSKYSPKNVTMREMTLAKEKLRVATAAEQQALREMEKIFDDEVKAGKKVAQNAYRAGRKFEAEMRKQKRFGSSVTKDQRRELYVLALKKGVIYTDYAGKTHDKLSGLIRYYKGASFDQVKNYLTNLTGDKENPAQLFKLYGDINKDAEALQIINKEKEGWRDINGVEVYSLDPVRIVEKVTGQDIWNGNVLADNTFNVISAADEAMFDRKVQELKELDLNREGIFAGSKESADLMRKFEAKEPMSPKEQRVVDFLRAKYDALIKEANEMRALLGKKPIPYRQDYMTHIVEANMLRDFFAGNERSMASIPQGQMDAIRKGDYTKGNMPFNQFAQKRLGDKTKFDAIGNYTRYLNTMFREIYFTPAITHARKFIEYALNKTPNAFKASDRLLNDLKGKVSIVDQNLIGTIAGSAPVKWLRTHISRSALIGNINFWTMNLSNFSTSYGELGNYVNIGMAKFLGSKKWRDFAFINSKMLKGRAIDPDFIDQPIHSKLETFVGGITNLIEYNNIGSAFIGGYFKATEEMGMSNDQAIEYADAIARRTQVGYKPYEVNAWMRSNSGKLMSQFQTWSFNAMNHILYDLGTANIPKDIQSMFTDKKTNRTRWGAFLTLVVTAMMANALYKKMGLREPYTIGSAMPTIAGMDVGGKFGDIGPARIARDVEAAFTSKKKETRTKAGERVVGSVIPGGAQAVRLLQGNVFPENKQGKKKIKLRD